MTAAMSSAGTRERFAHALNHCTPQRVSRPPCSSFALGWVGLGWVGLFHPGLLGHRAAKKRSNHKFMCALRGLPAHRAHPARPPNSGILNRLAENHSGSEAAPFLILPDTPAGRAQHLSRAAT